MEQELTPFFIFGSGRSGSSLISRILDAHPNIGVPYESHMFNGFYSLLKHYGDLEKEKNRARLVHDILSTDVMHDWQPSVDRRQVLSSIDQHHFGGIINAIMKTWVTSQGKRRWGEKTPDHLFYWREILHFFPDARFIHVVRDGRDVSLSLVRARFGPKTLFTAASQWVKYLEEYDSFKKNIEPTMVIDVRYEDLLTEPQRELGKLCNFLGEPFAESMLQYHERKRAYKTDQTNLENLNKPLLRNNKEKWKRELNQNEIRIIESVAQEMLIKYGYMPAVQDPSLSSLEKAYRRYVESPPKKFISMAKNRKSQIAALIRLKILFRLLVIHRFVRHV